MPKVALIALVAGVFLTGCGPKNYYNKPEVGPHGAVTLKRVYFTPEELAARDVERRQEQGIPTDTQFRTVEQMWPRLTEEQRSSIVRTMEQMTQGR